MVGRKQEITLLLDRWELARAGEGQIALLQGEPGIGKSRMLRRLRERSVSASKSRFSISARRTHEQRVLPDRPITWSARCAFSAGDDAEHKLDKLERHGPTCRAS